MLMEGRVRQKTEKQGEKGRCTTRGCLVLKDSCNTVELSDN